jgi:hypothetical protein
MSTPSTCRPTSRSICRGRSGRGEGRARRPTSRGPWHQRRGSRPGRGARRVYGPAGKGQSAPARTWPSTRARFLPTRLSASSQGSTAKVANSGTRAARQAQDGAAAQRRRVRHRLRAPEEQGEVLVGPVAMHAEWQQRRGLGAQRGLLGEFAQGGTGEVLAGCRDALRDVPQARLRRSSEKETRAVAVGDDHPTARLSFGAPAHGAGQHVRRARRAEGGRVRWASRRPFQARISPRLRIVCSARSCGRPGHCTRMMMWSTPSVSR